MQQELLGPYNKLEKQMHILGIEQNYGCYWKKDMFIEEDKWVIKHTLNLPFKLFKWQNKM